MEATILPHHSIDCCCLLLSFAYSQKYWQCCMAGFFPPNILFERFLHVSGRIGALLYSAFLWLCVYKSFFIHPTFDEHGGCSPVGTIMSNTMEIHMQDFETHTCMCAFLLGKHAHNKSIGL